VVFNAHDHCLTRTYPLKNNEVQKDPRQGTVYYITGRSGGKSYGDVRQKKEDAFFYTPQDQPCYFSVQVSMSKLIITAKKQDHTLLDSYTIDKSK
jgi:acid phosphatase type 7